MNGAIDIELCHWVLSPVLPFAAELVLDWCAGVGGKTRSCPAAPSLLIRRAIDQAAVVPHSPVRRACRPAVHPAAWAATRVVLSWSWSTSWPHRRLLPPTR